MRMLSAALVCLLVGLGTGFVVGRSSAPPSSAPASAPFRPAVAMSMSAPASASGPSIASAADLSTPRAADSGATKDVERLRALEREIMRLRGVVDAVHVERREIEGTPIAFPPGHAPDIDERAFHDSLNKALVARGLDGEVQALDCTEFPCIAHGLIRKDIDDLTMRGIADDAKKSLGWGAPYLSLSRFLDDKNPANSQSAFSVAIYPDDLPADEQANMNKRLRDRKNAYTDTN